MLLTRSWVFSQRKTVTPVGEHKHVSLTKPCHIEQNSYKLQTTAQQS